MFVIDPVGSKDQKHSSSLFFQDGDVGVGVSSAPIHVQRVDFLRSDIAGQQK